MSGAGASLFSKAEIDHCLDTGDRLGFNLSLPSNCRSDAPLIVLLGWLGCQDRWLKKYGDILATEGYPTLRAICSSGSIFWPSPAPRKRFAEDLLRFIAVSNDESNGLPHRPIVFYVFSNGGGFIIDEISKLMVSARQTGKASWLPDGQHSMPRFLGTIFDSAPCYMHASVGARAIGEGKSLPLRVALASVFYFSLAIGFILHPYWPQKYWSEMESLDIGGPTLYLYSLDDELCDSGMLKQLINARKQRGHDVREKCWTASPHVSHLRAHPEEYTKLVLEFIKAIEKNA